MIGRRQALSVGGRLRRRSRSGAIRALARRASARGRTRTGGAPPTPVQRGVAAISADAPRTTSASQFGLAKCGCRRSPSNWREIRACETSFRQACAAIVARRFSLGRMALAFGSAKRRFATSGPRQNIGEYSHPIGASALCVSRSFSKLSMFEKKATSMSLAIPGLGQILASHSASGVSASAPAARTTLSNLIKNLHADANQIASQSRFEQIFNSIQSPGGASTTNPPAGKS